MDTSGGQAQVPARAIVWPEEILGRINRVIAYHQSSKLNEQILRTWPRADYSKRPDVLPIFSSFPKIALPTNLLSADEPMLSLMKEGLAAMPESQLNPPHDLRTLASWLYYSNGLIKKEKHRDHAGWQRTLPSSGDTYPCEMYVAAFNVDGLEPGLYHFSPREFSLRQLRKGLEVLSQMKRGRPDLEFLKTIPAAILVSTIFSRSTWRYHQRGYRTALLDAGQAMENLVAAATALGMKALARLRVSDSATRELIGANSCEAVQGIVSWMDSSSQVIAAPVAGAMQEISRSGPGPEGPACEMMSKVHEDCVAPGVAIREIHPPLTELSPLAVGVPAYERPPLEEPSGGRGFGPIVMQRKALDAFHRKPISRDQFLAISQLAVRSATYYPMVPGSAHVALVRPIWFIHDVIGMDQGVWYHHPPTDQWSLVARGEVRMESAYLSAEQNLVADASAVCVLVADIHDLTKKAGPDLYRLANLEAGIVAHRMQLLAEAQGLAAAGNPIFYDDDLRKYFSLEQTGWEILYEVCIGHAVDPNEPMQIEAVDEVVENDWRG